MTRVHEATVAASVADSVFELSVIKGVDPALYRKWLYCIYATEIRRDQCEPRFSAVCGSHFVEIV